MQGENINENIRPTSVHISIVHGIMYWLMDVVIRHQRCKQGDLLWKYKNENVWLMNVLIRMLTEIVHGL